MRYKLILFIIGFLVAVIGLLPLVFNIAAVAQFIGSIAALAQLIGSLPQPGTLTYQLILFLLGMVAIGYSLKKEQLREKRQER